MRFRCRERKQMLEFQNGIVKHFPPNVFIINNLRFIYTLNYAAQS